MRAEAHRIVLWCTHLPCSHTPNQQYTLRPLRDTASLRVTTPTHSKRGQGQSGGRSDVSPRWDAASLHHTRVLAATECHTGLVCSSAPELGVLGMCVHRYLLRSTATLRAESALTWNVTKATMGARKR